MTKFHNVLSRKIGWYSKWHSSSSHRFIHWAVFFTFCFGMAIYLLSIIRLQIGGASADEILLVDSQQVANEDLADLNLELINLNKQIRYSGSIERPRLAEELRLIAERRSEVIRDSMQNNPEYILQNTLNRSLVANIPGDIQQFFEERKRIKGNFEYLHIHHGEFDSGFTEDIFYVIENGTNRKYKVNLVGNNVHALTGDVVSIDGVVFGDQIAANAENVTVLETATLPPNVRKVITLLVNFSAKNLTLNPVTIRQNIYDLADNYFRENSFEKWGLVGKNTEDGSGDVFGPYTIAYDGNGCDTSTIRTQAKNAAISNGVDISGYDNFVYYFPNTNCGFSGSATVGGNPAYVNMNGTLSQGTTIHELGHNMGAHHASSWSCTEGGVRVSVSSDGNCTLGEYGDPYDVMGTSSGMRHFNNYHKGITLNSLNWLVPQNTQTIDRKVFPDGTYSIVPIENQSSGIQSLRIPRNVSGNTVIDYYYIEFRQPIGFDASINTNAINGVTIRIAPNYNSTVRSKLVDTTPNTTSFLDAPLALNKTFTDPYNGINITTLSVSPSIAVVRVSFGELPCTEFIPSLSISPSSMTGTPGQALNYTYTLTNNNTATCADATFGITASVPSGWFTSPSTLLNETLSSGASVSKNITIVSSESAGPGSYTFTMTATNEENTSMKASGSSNYGVTVPDTTPPTVVITSPSSGTVLGGANLVISATASDDKGVTKVEFYLDGKLVGRDTSSPYSTRINIKKLSSGSHEIIAKAYDQAGNIGLSGKIVVSK